MRRGFVLRVLLAGLAVAAACTGGEIMRPPVGQSTLTTDFHPMSTGTGHIISVNQTYIDCPSDCSEKLDDTTHVILMADPDAGSVFTGWSGDCSGTVPVDTLVLLTDLTCLARFDTMPVAGATLTIAFDPTQTGAGSVTGQGITCGIDCSEKYPLNTTVMLTASPDLTSSFSGWSGDCAGSGSNPTPQIVMDADKHCIARFDDITQPNPFVTGGSYSWSFQVEGMDIDVTSHQAFAAAYGDPQLRGTVITYTNSDSLSGTLGAFSTCADARAARIYHNKYAPYNQDILHTLCPGGRAGSLTPTGGGFTQLRSYTFEPGSLEPYTDSLVSITDYEFGKLQLLRQDPNSGTAPVAIDLSPGERSCPWSQAIHGDTAYVVGEEGQAGTSTANCDNWRGVWAVDLKTQLVLGFTPFGLQLRDIKWGPNNKLYVSDFGADSVYVYDPATLSVDHAFGVGSGPVGMAFLNTELLIADWNSNKVELYDINTEQSLGNTDSGGTHPVDVFVDGMTALVLNFGDTMNNIGGTLKAFTLQ